MTKPHNSIIAVDIDLRRRALLALGVAAALQPSRRASASPAQAEAAATIARFDDALLRVMQAGTTTEFSRRFDLIGPAIDQTFDLPAVLAVSVGPGWPTLPPDQRARLLTEFRRYTVASYVANFDVYSGQRFAILPEIRGLDAGRIVVQTCLTSISGEATRLDYVMQPTSGNWKAVDVLAAGSISRVAVQRSDFRHVLSQGGGDALVASLRRKTSGLSGNALA
ncbi:MAG TPA: ABC transporter substrate-binding protein [Rhodopila sp.]